MGKATIRLTAREQQRAHVLTRVLASELTLTAAAQLMEVSERQAYRLRERYLAGGPAGLAHGNRGRPSPRATPVETAERVLLLARTRYDGANDTHFTELIASEEGLSLGRATVRRILRSGGQPSPRRRRAPKHRSRRERMPQEGLLLQVDGSRHDWLEGRGPWLSLLAMIDDATGRVTAAVFRDEEDSAGYLHILRDTVRRCGIPVAIYRDGHGAFATPERRLPDRDLRLTDHRAPTQLGRALATLGIRSIEAGSPQAKGRIERLWGTLQDRLRTLLRLAGICDREGANRILAAFLPDFNSRFAVPARVTEPAWRVLDPGLDLDAVCAFHYERVVANDHTIRVGGLVLDLPPLARQRGYAGHRVDVQVRLDGTLHVVDRGRTLLVTRPDLDPARLRSLEVARPRLTRAAPSPLRDAPGYPAPRDHPWRRVTPGSRLEAEQRDATRPSTDRFTEQLD